MTGLEAVKAGHDEEEECLFFVALSRARDRLFLYASSVQSDGKTRNPSKFIPAINHLLVRPPNPAQRNGRARPETSIRIAWEEKPVWTDKQVNLFADPFVERHQCLQVICSRIKPAKIA